MLGFNAQDIIITAEMYCYDVYMNSGEVKLKLIEIWLK